MTGAGIAISETKASNEAPQPQPRVVNMSGAKIGRMQAITDRNCDVQVSDTGLVDAEAG